MHVSHGFSCDSVQQLHATASKLPFNPLVSSPDDENKLLEVLRLLKEGIPVIVFALTYLWCYLLSLLVE